MTVCIPYIQCIPLYDIILCYWTCWPTTIVTTVASTHFNYILRVALWTFFKISCHSYHWMGVYISMIYIEVYLRVNTTRRSRIFNENLSGCNWTWKTWRIGDSGESQCNVTYLPPRHLKVVKNRNVELQWSVKVLATHKVANTQKVLVEIRCSSGRLAKGAIAPSLIIFKPLLVWFILKCYLGYMLRLV